MEPCLVVYSDRLSARVSDAIDDRTSAAAGTMPRRSAMPFPRERQIADVQPCSYDECRAFNVHRKKGRADKTGEVLPARCARRGVNRAQKLKRPLPALAGGVQWRGYRSPAAVFTI
jgi:hypothetical protein